jgi:hypothetical protein
LSGASPFAGPHRVEMPRTIPFTPALSALIASQDGVITVEQLSLHGLTPSATKGHVRRGEWQRILPGVILTHGGEPTRQQRLVAASLRAGPEAAVDGVSACFEYGLRVARFNPTLVHLVVPESSPMRTGGWVRIRRCAAEQQCLSRGPLRYVLPPTAVIVAARARTSKPAQKDAIAVLSRALQTGLVTLSDLANARDLMGDKWCRCVDGALADVGVGIRSVAEKDMLTYVRSSAILPEPTWNQWLDLGDGGSEVCTDALLKEAGMFHEVNGKKYHGWGEQFENTHVKIERMTAAGLVATQATALRWRREGPAVLASLERTYLRNEGRGMPPGVRCIDSPEWALASRRWLNRE